MISKAAGDAADGAGAGRALKASAVTWFTVAAAGQFAFAGYIAMFYGGTALAGDWAAWTRRLLHGFVDADLAGNLNVLAHMALAFIMCVGGPLQFIPTLRRRWPVLHRWNGRLFLTAAVCISAGGLYLIWTRGMAGLVNEIALSLNAILIIAFAILTIRHAIARRFDVHQTWALRLFVVAGGVWFFRVGYGFWHLATGGVMPGVGPMLNGPFDYVLAFASYLAPLAVLIMYQHAQRAGGARLQLAVAALVFGGAGLTGVGVAGAAMLFWLPTLAG